MKQSRGGALFVAVNGIAVALFGLAVVVGLNARSSEPEAAPETATDGTTAAPTTTAAPEPELEPDPVTVTTVIHVETPPPVIEGVPEAVARVLANRGFTENLVAGENTEDLPDSVTMALAEHGVTLYVAEEAP